MRRQPRSGIIARLRNELRGPPLLAQAAWSLLVLASPALAKKDVGFQLFSLATGNSHFSAERSICSQVTSARL